MNLDEIAIKFRAYDKNFDKLIDAFNYMRSCWPDVPIENIVRMIVPNLQTSWNDTESNCNRVKFYEIMENEEKEVSHA